MYHPAETLSFGRAAYGRKLQSDEPSGWGMLAKRLMAWRRPSTKVVLRRLDSYLQTGKGLAPGDSPRR